MRSNPTSLELQLAARIGREGPITFRDFMHAALYDPEQGYYRTQRLKIGPAGDYYTSSNVHVAFGAVVAQAFAELLGGINGDFGPLALVEIGAGTGQLAADILDTMRHDHAATFDRLSYLIVETSPQMCALQHAKLIDFAGRVQWRDLDELINKPITGLIFSNELIDAMPVHRVRMNRGRIQEMYVTTTSRQEVKQVDDHLPIAGGDEFSPGHSAASSSTGTHLVPVWGEPSTSTLEAYLARNNVALDEGQAAEIALEAGEWLARVSLAIERGFLVTIDYGDVAGHLYDSTRREGTLRSFSRHVLVDSILERVGEQDITASVNFTALIEGGRECGLETVSYERQVAFLIRNGLIDRIAAAESAGGNTADALKERLAVKNLFVPGAASDNFRVLIQRKREGPAEKTETQL